MNSKWTNRVFLAALIGFITAFIGCGAQLFVYAKMFPAAQDSEGLALDRIPGWASAGIHSCFVLAIVCFVPLYRIHRER